MFLSKKALNHSSKGTFKFKDRKPTKLLTGGHGQRNINYLNKNNFNYDIDSVFSNGVRLGHIEKHNKSKPRKENGHAWFPNTWNDKKIEKAGKYVASLKKNQNPIDGERYTGKYDNVSVGIICRNKKIQTVFPNFDVNKDSRSKRIWKI